MRAGREPDAAAMIDPDSRVHPDAVLAPGVEVGPWTTIGAGVEIGAGTRVGAHVVIAGAVRIGRDNRIHPYCSIGDRNVFREYCSVNRGSPKDQGLTRIGNDNYFMTGAHVAHDCVVGSHAVFANNATLAGHVEVGDHAFLSGFCGIHQFCRVGESAFVGPSAVVLKDVPPFVTVAGNTAQPHGLNRVGLRRRGFSADEIDALRRAYKLLYRKGLTRAEAQLRLDALAPASAHLQRFAEFLRASKRGIVR
jgi:UDP-N-acetylglucosamine acyltransferase